MYVVCLGHVILDRLQSFRHLGQHFVLLRIYVCVLLRTLWLHLPRHGGQRHGHRHFLVYRNPRRHHPASSGSRVPVLPIHDPPDTSRPSPTKTADYDQVQVQIRRAYPPARVNPSKSAVIQSVGLCVCSRGRFRWTDYNRVDDANPQTPDFYGELT